MPEPVSYDPEKIEAYLDECLVRGEVILVLPTKREALNLRWAFYKRRGSRPISVHVKDYTVSLRLKLTSREKLL